MRNIKITIEYDGTNYSGWQIQQKRPGELGSEKTIQGVIERVLGGILQEEIRITGAGRTDSGVHALGQVANFKTRSKMPMAAVRMSRFELMTTGWPNSMRARIASRATARSVPSRRKMLKLLTLVSAGKCRR